MALLTRECDYGVRTIRALADGEKKTVGEICKIEDIPFQYTYKISKKLEHAGLLRSLRGRGGGYQLAKSLDTFTLFDIVIAIDERLFLNECLDKNKPCPRHTGDDPCAVHLELERLQNLLIAELQSKTIQEVMSQEIEVPIAPESDAEEPSIVAAV
ncbi:MAG: Rrf2 family transcriptional regulator [Oscillospiraceae bacterium]|nr:Rrf2 family transcriptional regulator [Oscillospiraceae bacterium]